MSDITETGYLHLTLHLVNGSQKPFVQSDPATAQGILHQLRPERLFAQKQLVITSDDTVTIIPLENIERVDLRTDPLPLWEHTARIDSVSLISPEEFGRIQRREPPRLVPGAPQVPPAQVGVQVELRSGAVACLRVRPSRPGAEDSPREELTPDDSRVFFQHLFTRPVLFGALEDDLGLFLLNPANAVSFTLTPPAPEPSAGSWQMQMVTP